MNNILFPEFDECTPLYFDELGHFYNYNGLMFCFDSVFIGCFGNYPEAATVEEMKRIINNYLTTNKE